MTLGFRQFLICSVLVLLVPPMVALADKAPGYEKYPEGHTGYLGDGILKEDVDAASDLARAVQNPVADLISLPFQNNTNFNFGPLEKTQNVLNVQPVIPVHLDEDWLMITRTILPLVSQPAVQPGQDREFGLGDTLFTAFFSPKDRAVGSATGSGEWVRRYCCLPLPTTAWDPVSGERARLRWF